MQAVQDVAYVTIAFDLSLILPQQGVNSRAQQEKGWRVSYFTNLVVAPTQETCL